MPSNSPNYYKGDIKVGDTFYNRKDGSYVDITRKYGEGMYQADTKTGTEMYDGDELRNKDMYLKVENKNG